MQEAPVNLLLLGAAGAGKSSFVNTFASALEGRIMETALAGRGTQQLTRELTCYSVHPHIALWDTMGWDSSKATYRVGEFGYLLDGQVPEGTNLMARITPSMPGFRHTPTLADRMHACAIVLQAADATCESTLEYIRNVRDFVWARGTSAARCALAAASVTLGGCTAPRDSDIASMQICACSCSSVASIARIP